MGYWVAEEQMVAGKEDGLMVVNGWVCCNFGGYRGGWFRFGKGCCGCYDEGKRTAETLTMDYHRGTGIEVRIARIFNTYGPRMCIDDGHVVSNFVASALRKEPLAVYGDGKQTRSFQYV